MYEVSHNLSQTYSNKGRRSKSDTTARVKGLQF